MGDDERRSSKRSRFDQTEPEVKRSSRFDQGSRQRSRSPVAEKSTFSPGPEGKKGPADPAAAAGRITGLLFLFVHAY